MLGQWRHRRGARHRCGAARAREAQRRRRWRRRRGRRRRWRRRRRRGGRAGHAGLAQDEALRLLHRPLGRRAQRWVLLSE